MPPDDPIGAAPPDARAPHGPTRGLPTLLLLIAGVLLVARIAVSIYEAKAPVKAVKGLVEWQTIAAGEALAKSSGKPILYDFTAEWCGPCRLLERDVFAHRESAALIQQSFVAIRVLDRQREEGRNPPDVAALQARYEVRAFPTLVVVRPDGSVADRLEGFMSRNATMMRLSQASVKVAMPAPRRR